MVFCPGKKYQKTLSKFSPSARLRGRETYAQYCYNNYMKISSRVIGAAVLFLCVFAPGARAFFPFNLGRQEVKTDYSQTVWDRIMREQSVSDMRRGMGEMAASRHRDAANSFAKAVIKNPQDPLPHLLYGASLYWSGRVDGAMTEYREALRLDPQNAMGYQLLGIAWGWKGDIVQAQENFLAAEELNPYKADTHMNLGSTYAAQKEWDKALDEYRRAVELAPKEPLFHYQLGGLYDFLGRDQLAEESYKKALKYFYNYEDAQLALAALYEKRENYAAALKYYKKAVKTKPGDFTARLRYAWLLLRRGEPAKARAVTEEAFSVSRFKADGLALNAVYRAAGRDERSFREQIERFQASLLKVPPAKDVVVEAALDFDPLSSPREPEKSKFAEAYETLRGRGSEGASAVSFRRSFVLSGTEAAARAAQVKELADELRRVVSSAAGKYNVGMTLSGRTPDYASPSALTQQRSAPPKAVYDPRIVGNDMGLWVTGKTWLRYVEEIVPDLDERTVQTGDAESFILRGLAALLLGNAADGTRAFETAQTASAADPLPLLGLGTAAVIAADDQAAAAYYKQALLLQPDHATAKRNLAALEEE